ncbi:MAG: hypothetical protein R3336_05255 [Phycisphaeraceae bacterium]|nr:hypothetical protein [Phycisphaeraceae bacterium]
MTGWTLTFRDDAPAPGDGAWLAADRLGPLDEEALSAVEIRAGRGTHPLGELFEIEGEPGDAVTVRNLPVLDRIGEQMAGGSLTIEGDAGDHLGASMAGGHITVRGDAGFRVGGPAPGAPRGMTGGTIAVSGDAGEEAGCAQRRGTILICGQAGRAPGYRMIAGTLAIGTGRPETPGLAMRRGTLILLDPTHADTDPNLTATIDSERSTADWVAGRLVLQELDRINPQPDSWAKRVARWRILRADPHELNRGEIWQALAATTASPA